jgi:hypothetical protein
VRGYRARSTAHTHTHTHLKRVFRAVPTTVAGSVWGGSVCEWVRATAGCPILVACMPTTAIICFGANKQTKRKHEPPHSTRSQSEAVLVSLWADDGKDVPALTELTAARRVTTRRNIWRRKSREGKECIVCQLCEEYPDRKEPPDGVAIAENAARGNAAGCSASARRVPTPPHSWETTLLFGASTGRSDPRSQGPLFPPVASERAPKRPRTARPRQ